MLLSKQYATRKLLYLGLGTLLILLIFAWRFYQERICYIDSAFFLHYLLRDKTVFFQHHRFIAVIAQLPLLLVIKAEMPLYLVEIFYSMMFVLYYLTIFLLCAFWFRNQQIALVVTLLCVLLAARTFYWIESELPQALALLLLFYAGISRQAPLQRRFSTLALAALIPVYIFGHPLIILPFLFIWTYDWLLNRRFKDWAYYGLLIIGIGSYKMRDMLIEPGSYEANKMTFVPNLIAHFPNYLALQSFQDFWKLCSHNFVAVPILLLALSVFYIRQRTLEAWLRLLLVWAFAFGYVLVINVSYPEGTDATYIENLLLPLTLIVTIPFAMELLPALESRNIFKLRGTVFVTSILAITFIIRLVVIWKNHTPTTAYQQWIGQMMAYTRQFPEHKFILAPENVNAERQAAGQPTWGITIESMLRSAAYDPDSAQTIYAGTENYLLVEARAKGDLFIGPFEKWTIYDIPETYFRLPEKTYRTLNTPPPPEDTTALRTYIDARRAVRLTLADSLPAVLRSGRNQQVQVVVTVPNEAQPLHSSLNSSYPTLLRASFYQSPNWPSDVPASETPLEVDVWHPWNQLITVHTPNTPGQYTLEITLFSKGYRDWPVRLLRTVEVK